MYLIMAVALARDLEREQYLHSNKMVKMRRRPPAIPVTST